MTFHGQIVYHLIASVMTGKYKGVAKFVADQNGSVFISGCPCHLVIPV
jgi:hypothetical protein